MLLQVVVASYTSLVASWIDRGPLVNENEINAFVIDECQGQFPWHVSDDLVDPAAMSDEFSSFNLGPHRDIVVFLENVV